MSSLSKIWPSGKTWWMSVTHWNGSWNTLMWVSQSLLEWPWIYVSFPASQRGWCRKEYSIQAESGIVTVRGSHGFLLIGPFGSDSVLNEDIELDIMEWITGDECHASLNEIMSDDNHGMGKIIVVLRLICRCIVCVAGSTRENWREADTSEVNLLWSKTGFYRPF